jgi:uncharacterized protein (DUF1810 family)
MVPVPLKHTTRGKQLRNGPEFDPAPFLDAQKAVWSEAIRQLSHGRKEGHWIWFIFPQLRALGTSTCSEIYGLDGASDARSYVENSALRGRLHKCVQAVLDGTHKDVNIIFNPLDAMKFHACLTLFNEVQPDAIFRSALDTFFEGKAHQRTIELLRDECQPGLTGWFKRHLPWQRFRKTLTE